jgi:hypothetical protein
MKANIVFLIFVNLIIFAAGVLIIDFNKEVEIKPEPPIKQIISVPKISPPKNNITNAHPAYMNYAQIVKQLKQWNSEAPDMTDVKVYGKSTKGEDLYYIRICDTRSIESNNKPCVLVTACIHGNEPLATSTTMWYIGELLKSYNDNEDIKSLLDSRDIYFVPVVSPDSYPTSRMVDGVDPNRNFSEEPSVAPVEALKNLFKTIRPKAVVAGHTWGRVYLTPYGDVMKNCPNHSDYERIVGKMSELSGYRKMRACDMYKGNGKIDNPPIRTTDGYPIGGHKVMVPIYGTEVDWYYKNGSFPIIIEFGTHQRIPTTKDTEDEFDRTFEAFLHFIQEAPLVEINELLL